MFRRLVSAALVAALVSPAISAKSSGNYEKALTLFNGGRYAKALALVDKTIAENPKNADSHALRGRALDALERLEEAASAYKKALELGVADRHVVLNDLGVSYGKNGDPAAAVRALAEAVRLAPGYAPSHYNLGIAYFNAGEVLRARGEFETLRALGEADLAQALWERIYEAFEVPAKALPSRSKPPIPR